VKKVLILALIGVFLVGGQAFGSLWNFYDFGDPFDHNNNWSPIDYPGVGHLPSPGGAEGENFDLEGAFFAQDEDYLYFGLTNSFGVMAYSTGWDHYYPLGDLFFGFNGNYTDYAINFDADRGYLSEVTSYDLIPEMQGSYGSPIREMVDAYRVNTGKALGSDFEMAVTRHEGIEANPLNPSVNTDAWLLEVKIAKSMFDFDFATLEMVGMHQTVACGNDLIHEDFGIIPEPGTLVLLGLGLIGVGSVRRLRRK